MPSAISRRICFSLSVNSSKNGISLLKITAPCALSDYPEITSFESIRDISRLDSFIETNRPDILLMDINLKNIASEDGLELAKQMYADPAR